MENFTIMDGVVVTVISILVVFIVLIGLQLVISLFRTVLERQKNTQMDSTTETIKSTNQENSLSQSGTLLEEDEETKTVAALMALILANEDQQDKQYQITSIKRIR